MALAFNWMSCNFLPVSADSKGLDLSWITWNFRVCFVLLCLMCRSHSPVAFIVEPPNSFNLTEEFFIGGSPNCVMAERSSKQSTLQVAPVSSWHAKIVQKSSWSELKNVMSANHCLDFVWTNDTVSTLRQLSSELDSWLSSNWCSFFDDMHIDAKWPFFWHLLHACPNAGQSVFFTWRCLRPQYLHFVSEFSHFVFSSEFFSFDNFSSFFRVGFFGFFFFHQTSWLLSSDDFCTFNFLHLLRGDFTGRAHLNRFL